MVQNDTEWINVQSDCLFLRHMYSNKQSAPTDMSKRSNRDDPGEKEQ